jgi:hypothetical protein
MWMREKQVNTLRLKSSLVFDSAFHHKAVAISNITQGDFLTGSFGCADIKIKTYVLLTVHLGIIFLTF